jgi:hypothetical protein
MKKGRAGTMTHDYKRNGTTTLFAALSMLDGKVIGACMPRHRHREFLRFLKLIDQNTPAGLDLHLVRCHSAWQPNPGRGSTYRRSAFSRLPGLKSPARASSRAPTKRSPSVEIPATFASAGALKSASAKPPPA